MPSRAVHRVVSEWAVVVLIAVSGETPEWPGLARNIGQSAALAVPAIPSAPAIATPAAAMTSAGLDCGLSFDISMLLSLVVYYRLPRAELARSAAFPTPGLGVLPVEWQMSLGVDGRPGKDSHNADRPP